ncbi:MAG: FAD-binding oxidoreductase [Hyphomicrobium sp.]|jgi:FAD/FMN-containing dehydrogenase
MTQNLPYASAAQPSDELIERLVAVVGSDHAIRDPAAQAPYLREWRDRYTGRTALVLKPATTAEVSQILALANAAGVGIVTQGGNTGLVGGQIPSETGQEIVLSLTNMNRVREIDAALTFMTVEAGLTLAAAQGAAEGVGRLFPLSMASEGSATIGGNLATNAGGVAVLAYGTARSLVLGLEVVLADGTIWNGLRSLKKDNTGYDLRDLFVGSEGTLGVITAATLKLVPQPREKATALVAVPTLDALLPLFRLAEEMGGTRLTAFEFMCCEVMGFVTRHMAGIQLPFSAPPPWSVLVEISGAVDGEARHVLEGLLAGALQRGLATDAVVASSLTQAHGLWRIREACSEAQKGEGGSIKHDVSVPVARIADLLRLAGAEVQRICPGARPVPFGHLGDGNVHYNVSQPLGMDKAAYLALWEPMTHAVHRVVLDLGGSISAEHGIGRMKRAELARIKSGIEIDLMRRIKDALDPRGILNPGKVI